MLRTRSYRPGAGDGGVVADHGLVRRLAPDPINMDILAWVGGRLVPREHAKVSAFDSAVQVGGGVGCVLGLLGDGHDCLVQCLSAEAVR